jgi:hypothetical protein
MPNAAKPLPLCLAVLLTACAGAATLPPATASDPILVDLPYLAAAFQDGSRLPAGPLTVTARTLEIRSLTLPDGKVIVADAFASGDDVEPLALTVPPGSYPVVLSLVSDPASPYETIAAAMLRLSSGEPVAWHLATTPAQDPANLAQDEIFGYPVDSGTAMVASPAGARRYVRKLVLFGNLNYVYLQHVSQTMEANAPNGGGWANLVLDAGSGENVIVFQSGYGDGFYTSYWGYDAEGQLVCLVTDFDLLYMEDPGQP